MSLVSFINEVLLRTGELFVTEENNLIAVMVGIIPAKIHGTLTCVKHCVKYLV